MPSNPETSTHQHPDQHPARRFQCRHIRATGLRCGMVSLRGESLCYYHHTNRRPHPRAAANQLDAIIPIPLIEDRASIQLTINDILARLAANTIDTRRAGLILYGLQIASHNLPKEPRAQPKSTETDDDVELRAVEDLTLDPDLGPLAPVNEIIPDVEPPSLIQQLLDDRNRPSEVCRRCVERDRRDANRAGVNHLIFQQEKEAPNNLEFRRLADQIRATLPNLNASAGPTPEPPTPQGIVILTLSAAEGEGPASPSESRHPDPERSEGERPLYFAAGAPILGCPILDDVFSPQPATCNPQPAIISPTPHRAPSSIRKGGTPPCHSSPISTSKVPIRDRSRRMSPRAKGVIGGSSSPP